MWKRSLLTVDFKTALKQSFRLTFCLFEVIQNYLGKRYNRFILPIMTPLKLKFNLT